MTPYVKEQLGCEGSMSQHDTLTLRDALREMIADVEDLKRPCSDPDSNQAARNSLYMSIAAKARAALSATQPAQAAQGAGEVVAWCTPDGERCVTAATMESAKRDGGAMLASLAAYTVAGYTRPTPPPAQPAPVVPDGWKLVPIKCTEAMKDVGGQFEFATIADGRLLAQSMWNELLLATPTPPAQAAADAQGTGEPMPEHAKQQYEFIRDRLNTPGMYGDRVGAFVDWFDALATHQQGEKA